MLISITAIPSLSNRRKFLIATEVNDEYGDGSKTLDVTGTLTLPGGEVIDWDDHWDNPKVFTPATSGQVTVELKAFTSSETGTFAIVFSSLAARPASN